uniref:Uncharacterized protein n=1 Tax=Romanomermis culicivorax TaxID=13658 RepID=A0A915KT89_ROMCU
MKVGYCIKLRVVEGRIRVKHNRMVDNPEAWHKPLCGPMNAETVETCKTRTSKLCCEQNVVENQILLRLFVMGYRMNHNQLHLLYSQESGYEYRGVLAVYVRHFHAHRTGFLVLCLFSTLIIVAILFAALTAFRARKYIVRTPSAPKTVH